MLKGTQSLCVRLVYMHFITSKLKTRKRVNYGMFMETSAWTSCNKLAAKFYSGCSVKLMQNAHMQIKISVLLSKPPNNLYVKQTK